MATATLNEPVVAGNPAQGIVYVEFHGFKIPTIMHDGKPHFAIKPICEAIGLDFSSQLRNIKRDAVLGTCVVKLTMQMPGDDQAREFTFLPVHFFNGWIFKVDANRYVKRTIREALITYQREGYDVMCAYFNRGIAVNPRVLDDAPANPSTTGTLTPSQQQEIKELVQAKASAYPDAVKRKVFSQIWTRLQRKFKVPRYEELPVALFGEARDYVIAMQIRSVAEPALEGEETKALPPARRRNTLDDYKNMYRELPESPQHWLRLITETFHATEAFERQLDAIKAEATKPFRSGRTSDVSSYFDASMSPMFDLFAVADEQLRLTYRCVYNALEGCRNTWLLLNKG